MPTTARLRAPRGEAMLLLVARTIREVAFGFISIVLPVYWHDRHYSVVVIGLLYSVTLIGSALLSIGLSRYIDRLGRKHILMISSVLWTLGAPFLLITHNVVVIGVVMLVASISPTGKEIGLYLGVEQAMLSRLVKGQARTNTYAWFNLVGYTSTAIGALVATAIGLASSPSHGAVIDNTLFRDIVLAYSAAGAIQLVLYGLLTPSVETESGDISQEQSSPGHSPTREVRRLVLQLSSLFALDSFAAGLIIQGVLVYWFRIRFHIDLTRLGLIFFGTNMLSALSSLVAARIARYIGLLNTMVFTHLPSNVLLMAIPLMPNATWSIILLLLRHLLSQMDVPTRQAYSMAMVAPKDRAYLAAWTNGARSFGTGTTPVLSGALLAGTLTMVPFLLAGALKIVYDLSLYATFKKVPLEFTEEL